MSLSACVEIVRRGDPDRFLAAMAAPPSARNALFPIYAFNVEIARAVQLIHEPMIARIRLQWWRDTLEEISSRNLARSHEIAGPLADVLDAESVCLLSELTGARERDIERRPFETEDRLATYLDRTAGNLMLATARAVGVTGSENELRKTAWASGLANLFLAIPQLRVRGYEPLPDPSPDAVRKLAAQGLAYMSHERPPRQAKPVLLAAWRARRILRLAHRRPELVGSGRLGGSEFMRRASLLWHAFAV